MRIPVLPLIFSGLTWSALPVNCDEGWISVVTSNNDGLRLRPQLPIRWNEQSTCDSGSSDSFVYPIGKGGGGLELSKPGGEEILTDRDHFLSVLHLPSLSHYHC